MEDIASSMEVVQSVVKETENHIAYCARHGITKDELLSSPESIVNIAYNRTSLFFKKRGSANYPRNEQATYSTLHRLGISSIWRWRQRRV